MAAPTLISYTESTNWAQTGNPFSTASAVTWLTGDILVCIGLNEGTHTLGTPTATGLTFTKNQDIAGSGSSCGAFVATAVAGSGGSSVVSVAPSNTGGDSGLGVWVYRGSSGVGNSTSQDTTGKTKSLTPVQADSAIVWAIADFSAGTVYTAGTPTPTNTRQKLVVGSNYTIGVFDLADQVSAGAVSYGATGGGATGPFAIVVQEIKGTSGSAVTLLPGAGSDLLTGHAMTMGFAIGMPDVP